jgi:hypothetical protein
MTKGRKAVITGTSVNFGPRKATSVNQVERPTSCGYSQRAAFFDPTPVYLELLAEHQAQVKLIDARATR